MPIETPSNNLFTTTDLGLCSALYATGFSPDLIDKSNPQRVSFHFQHSSELDQAIQAYWSNQLMVSAQAYFLAIRAMKNRIFSE